MLAKSLGLLWVFFLKKTNILLTHKTKNQKTPAKPKENNSTSIPPACLRSRISYQKKNLLIDLANWQKYLVCSFCAVAIPSSSIFPWFFPTLKSPWRTDVITQPCISGLSWSTSWALDISPCYSPQCFASMVRWLVGLENKLASSRTQMRFWGFFLRRRLDHWLFPQAFLFPVMSLSRQCGQMSSLLWNPSSTKHFVMEKSENA